MDVTTGAILFVAVWVGLAYVIGKINHRVLGSVVLGVGLILFFGGFYLGDYLSGLIDSGHGGVDILDIAGFFLALIIMVPGALIGLKGYRVLTDSTVNPEYKKPSYAILCGRCGAAISKDATNCDSCGAVADWSDYRPPDSATPGPSNTD